MNLRSFRRRPRLVLGILVVLTAFASMWGGVSGINVSPKQPTPEIGECGKDPAGYPAAPKASKSKMHATFRDRPGSVKELVSRADLILEARVVNVEEGEPLLPRNEDGSVVTGPDAIDASIPTRRITLATCEQVKGGPAKTLTVMQTGGPGLSLDESPEYTAGERYMLFLRNRKQPDGTSAGDYVPVAPEGRIFINSNNRTLSVAHHGEVNLSARSVKEIKELARG